MSREFDDIRKKIEQTNQELHTSNNHSTSNENDKVLLEIKNIKKTIKNMELKIDSILEILNSFTILLAEEDGDTDSYEEENENWLLDQDNWRDEEDG